MSQPTRRATIAFSERTAQTIDELTERLNLTTTDLIRQAIAHEKYLVDADIRGARVLVVETDGTTRELLIVR